jgi:cysteine desulfurase / selenocysteine lyase
LLRIANLWREQAIMSFAGEDTEVPSLDFAAVAAQFPIKRQRAYLNNASIAPMSEPVLAAVNAFLHDVRDNGRNNYPTWCRYSEERIKARVAQLIGARASEIAFVKNTTEGLVTVANGLDWREGDNVVLPRFEYPSNVYCWMRLARLGVSIRWVEPQDGRVPVDAIAEAIDARTRLVSLSAVQFSNGFRHDLAATSELCRKRGVLLNLDAIQWVGALALDLSDLAVDFLAFGGHKWLLAPIGTGIFYCSANALDRLQPPHVGYHSVEKSEAHLDYDLTAYRPGAARFEAALENFPGIWGLDAAVKILLGLGPRRVQDHILALNAYAAEGLRSRGWQIASPWQADERSGLLSFFSPTAQAEDLETRLRTAGVDAAVRNGKLRISPSYYNDRDDIDRLLAALPRTRQPPLFRRA